MGAWYLPKQFWFSFRLASRSFLGSIIAKESAREQILVLSFCLRGMANNMRLTAFDPDTVVPNQKTDWSDWLVSTEGHAAKKAKCGLPRMLDLAAFSNRVGCMPSGLNTGQVKYFVDRFPMEFRLAPLGRIILPHHNGDPFQTDDGKFPCPALSSCNALKVLQSNGELDDSNSNRDV